MIDEIREKVTAAAEENSKLAVFHCEILLRAEELENYNAVEFCSEIQVPDSYAVEFRKMIKVASILRDRGLKITNA